MCYDDWGMIHIQLRNNNVWHLNNFFLRKAQYGTSRSGGKADCNVALEPPEMASHFGMPLEAVASGDWGYISYPVMQ